MKVNYYTCSGFRMFIFCGITFLSCILFSCAQPGQLVKKVHTFYTERLPGNIPVFPSLIRRDTIVTIYAETTSRHIVWDTAYKGQNVYLIRANLIEQLPVEAGISRLDNQKIIINPAKGSFLWQLNLEPLDTGPAESLKLTDKDDKLLLKGLYKGKRFMQEAGTAVELIGLPSV